MAVHTCEHDSTFFLETVVIDNNLFISPRDNIVISKTVSTESNLQMFDSKV